MNAPTIKSEFKWDDPFLMSDQLTEEEQLIAQSARTFCESALMPRVLEAHSSETFDRD